MQTKPLVLRDFSGGLNTSAAEPVLPPNMTASLQNLDVLDSRSLRRRNGYVAVTASPVNGSNSVRAIFRPYNTSGAMPWVIITGTALMDMASLGYGGRVEVVDSYVAASSAGWYTAHGTAYSGGLAISATNNNAVCKIPLPLGADSFSVRLFFSPSSGSLTASLKIDNGAWQNITATIGSNPTDASGNYSVDVPGYTRSYSGLSATAQHNVYIKKHGTGTYRTGRNKSQQYQTWRSYVSVDYIDWMHGVASTHKDTTVSATNTAFGFAAFGNKLYYGSAYDDVRSYNGSTTATVSASGSCRGAFLVENKLRLFAAGDARDPAKLFYTDLAQPEDWTGGGSLYLAGKDSGQDCTGLEVWRNRVLYFSRSRIYALDTTGTPDNWVNEPISYSVGCVAPNSLVKVPNGLVFLSTQGVHLYGMGGEFTQEPGFTLLSDNITPTINGFTDAERTAAWGAYYNNRYWLLIGDTVLIYRFPESGLPGSWTQYRYRTGASRYLNLPEAAYDTSKSDEFDTKNTDKWRAYTPWGADMTTGELQFYDTANVTATNGELQLLTEERSVTATWDTPSSFDYASGVFTTKEAFLYGKFEVRSQLPKGLGIFPAFWLTDDIVVDGVTVGDGTSEIDVYEFLGGDSTKVYQNVHYTVGATKYDDGWTDVANSDWSDTYHVFAVDWQPEHIEWSIDGEVTKTITDTSKIPHVPMVACLNTAVGGLSGTPDVSTMFPQTHSISYMRYYQPQRDDRLYLTCLHTTRGDEPGLYAGTEDGRIVQLEVGTNDGGQDIDDYYVIPPVAPGGMETVKHFRPALDIGVEADTNQTLTITPYADGVSGDEVTVDVTPNTAVQTIRAPLSARGRALKVKLSGSGSGQPRTLTSVGYRFTPPRIR